MRIKHTIGECYKVYSFLPCSDKKIEQTRKWHPFKHYSTKQGAMKGIKLIKQKWGNGIAAGLIWKIVWCPYPFASDEECITVYEEEIQKNV